MAIRWLLDCYCSLKASKEQLVVVPVSICSDRIVEGSNLATEMINGEKEDYTAGALLYKLMTANPDAIGDVYVKYLEPVVLSDYLKVHALELREQVAPKEFEEIALQLTSQFLEK